MGRGEGPEDDLQSPWLTLLSLVPPLLLPAAAVVAAAAAVVAAAVVGTAAVGNSLAAPLVRSPFSGAGAAPMRARPLSRSLAPSFDRRRRCLPLPLLPLLALPLHLCTPALSLARWLPRSIAHCWRCCSCCCRRWCCRYGCGCSCRRVYIRAPSRWWPIVRVRPSCAHPVFCLLYKYL